MLSGLHIRDFAIIDELEIPFSEGLNVLTGETGTGKSIIINAVNLLLGGLAFGVWWFLKKRKRAAADAADEEDAE